MFVFTAPHPLGPWTQQSQPLSAGLVDLGCTANAETPTPKTNPMGNVSFFYVPLHLYTFYANPPHNLTRPPNDYPNIYLTVFDESDDMEDPPINRGSYERPGVRVQGRESSIRVASAAELCH